MDSYRPRLLYLHRNSPSGGCVGSRHRLEALYKRHIFCSYQETNNDSFIRPTRSLLNIRNALPRLPYSGITCRRLHMCKWHDYLFSGKSESCASERETGVLHLQTVQQKLPTGGVPSTSLSYISAWLLISRIRNKQTSLLSLYNTCLILLSVTFIPHIHSSILFSSSSTSLSPALRQSISLSSTIPFTFPSNFLTAASDTFYFPNFSFILTL